MKLEDIVSQEIQLESPKHKTTLYRNNSGAMTDATGRTVRYGLGHTSPNQQFKSSDFIGITEITITPAMVGQRIGVFTAPEIKKEGWKYKGDRREQLQKNFIDFIKSKGGIAEFCTSVDDFKKMIETFKKNLSK